MNTKIISTKPSKGFSIVEVAIAMGVVTLMLTTFLGIFGPAQKSVQRALNTKDINAMKDAIANELAFLRPTDTDFDTSFDKAEDYITGSHTEASAVLIYRYKALPSEAGNTSGIFPAFAGIGIPGKDYIIQTAVRKVGKDDNLITSELTPESIEGPVFAVRMTQLVNDNSGSLVLSSSVDSLLNPEDGSTFTDDYPDVVISYRAEFFQLPSNLAGFVNSGSWSFSNIGSPVVSANLTARR